MRKPRVRYPESLLRKQLDGDVWLVAHVDRSGWICSLRLAVSSGIPGLDDAALLGLRRWRLSPSLRDGVPVDALRVLGVSFGIEGQEFEK